MHTPDDRRPTVREALLVWAAAFGGLVTARLVGFGVPFVAGQVKTVAAVLFLVLPNVMLRRRGEYVDDYAVPPEPWVSRAAARRFGRDLAWGLGVSAILVPTVYFGFELFLWALEHLPASLRLYLAPYRSPATAFAFRLPDSFALHLLDQLLVVALPEEFFYRGYLQTTLTRALGPGARRLFGVQVGKAFLLTQLLFAVGHLGHLHVWRLGVFFPALLFGWLRERTGSIVPGVIVHAVSNLLLMTLEASYGYGRG